MSRILKRPMFRRGGMPMEGIMSGIKSRTNYGNGPENPRAMDPRTSSDIDYATGLYKEAFKGMAPSKDEILAKLLISGGLAGMSETGGGSTLANLARAFQKPAEAAISDYYAGKKLDKQAGLKGLEYGLGLKTAREIESAKNKDVFREQLVESQAAKLLDTIKSNPIVAPAYVKNYNKIKQAIRAGVDVDIVTDQFIDQKTGRIKTSYYQNKDGIVYINPFTNRFEKIVKGVPVQIDQTTFQVIKQGE